MDEAVHLLVLSHARGKLCSQMDESFLKGQQSLSRSPQKNRLPDEALGRKKLSHGGTRQMGLTLTELGPIQKFSCWTYFTFSYIPRFLRTYQ